MQSKYAFGLQHYGRLLGFMVLIVLTADIVLTFHLPFQYKGELGDTFAMLCVPRLQNDIIVRHPASLLCPFLPLLALLSIPHSCCAVENEAHCDFVKLREMLIRVNMEDLREQTHTRHYELYRRCKLEEMGFKDTDPDSKPFRYCSHQPSPAQPTSLV